MNTRRCAAVAGVALAAMGVVSAFAADGAQKTKTGPIKSVDATAKTVTLAGRAHGTDAAGDTTFLCDDATRVVVGYDKKAGALADLAGMTPENSLAVVSYVETSDGKLLAKQIQVWTLKAQR